MQLKPLSDDLSVTPQIAVGDVPELARLGFRSIIGNRPEGETPDQPAWEELAAEARKHGLDARQIPVVPGQIGDADVAAFGQALQDLPKPIAAFCRTGTRSAMLWALANSDSLPPEDRLHIAAEQGYDLSALRARLG